MNCITSLIDANSNHVSNEDKLCEVEHDYFIDLLQAQNNDIQPVIDVIHESISFEDNTFLTTPFVIDEFKEAIFFYEARLMSRTRWVQSWFFSKFLGNMWRRNLYSML